MQLFAVATGFSMIGIFCRYILPGRTLFGKTLFSNVYQEVMAMVKSEMDSHGNYSLITDMWTSSVSDGYMSLTVPFITDN